MSDTQRTADEFVIGHARSECFHLRQSGMEGTADVFERCIAMFERELATAQTKLSRFESAQMPEYPGIVVDGLVAGEKEVYWPLIEKKSYDTLRTFAAAQTVRAEENERDARRWNTCLRLRLFPVRLQQPLYKDGGYVQWTIDGKYYGGTENECVDAAIDAALKEQKT